MGTENMRKYMEMFRFLLPPYWFNGLISLLWPTYPEVSGAERCPASGRRAVWSSVVLYGLIWVTGVSQAGHMLAWRWFLQSWAWSSCGSLWKPAGVYEALWRQTAAQDCIHCAADPRLSSWDPSSGRFYSSSSWRAEDEAPSHVRPPASPAGQMSYWRTSVFTSSFRIHLWWTK